MDNNEVMTQESWDLDWISKDVYDALVSEIEYQKTKWVNNPHEIPGWITIMRWYLNLAEKDWMLGQYGDATNEIRKVVATGISCLEQYGVKPR